jgi:hypothetical protein
MKRIQHLVIVAATALATVVGVFVAAPTAAADPVCNGPNLPPCAGPSPLTPEQQCALIAWQTWTPCNWSGLQVPVGTPGSF